MDGALNEAGLVVGRVVVRCSMVGKCLVLAELVDKKKCLCHLLQQLGEVFARPLVGR